MSSTHKLPLVICITAGIGYLASLLACAKTGAALRVDGEVFKSAF